MEKMSGRSLYYFDAIDMLIKINSVIYKTAETTGAVCPFSGKTAHFSRYKNINISTSRQLTAD